MNIAETFLEQAKNRPHSPAIIEARRVITFAELDLASRRAASMLSRAGLRPGDAVLVLAPMSIDLYTVLIAIFRLGLVAMVFDPSAGKDSIRRWCEMYPPKGFIGSSKAHLLRLVSSSIRRIPHKFVVGSALMGAVSWSSLNRHIPCDELCPCKSDTPALLTFTSGSTGLPKAAMRNCGFLIAQYRALAESINLQPGEVDLTTLPIFALANLGAGVTSVIPNADLRYPGKIDPRPVLAQIDALKISRIGASPAFIARLVDSCSSLNLQMPSLKKIYTGGAPVFPRLLHKIKAVAPNAEITPVYGSTEAEPIAHLSMDQITPDDYAAMAGGKGLIAGTPVHSIKLRIIKSRHGQPIGPYTQDEFELDCMPAGSPGEIVVSGEHVLSGYMNSEADAETKFRVDGVTWHRTGDEGYLDDYGRLWLLGRSNARIEDDRGTLLPFSVECAAMNSPDIRRAAVIKNQNKRALVIEAETRRQVNTHDLQSLLDWAQLDEIRVIKHIPVDKRHNAKIDYPALTRLLDKTKA